jgi:hypothetical protein
VNGVRSNAATPESRKAKKAVTDTRYKKSAKGAATRRAQEHKAYWKDPKGNSEKRMKLYRENPERYAAYRTGVDPATLTKRPDLCEVCGEPPKFNVLHLDHDHKTKKFRGWLCHHCNTSLGQMKDSPATLRALADYLERKNVS